MIPSRSAPGSRIGVLSLIGAAALLTVATASPAAQQDPQRPQLKQGPSAAKQTSKPATEIAVKFAPGRTVTLVERDGKVQTGLAAVDELCDRLGVTAIRPLAPVRRLPRVHAAEFKEIGIDRIHRLTFKSGADLEQAAAAFAALADVEYASPPRLAHATVTPNDPKFPNQWSLQNDRLAGPRAWNVETDATGVPVAVIDTGADMQHNDFKTNRWVNTGEINSNGIDDDGNGYIDDRFGFDFVNNDGNPDDDNGHGTHTSGTIGAVGNNGLDIAGICWIAEVMACKALDANGVGFLFDAAEALVYAADNGAQVANMSFGSGSDDRTLRDAVDYAAAANMTEVAAAGNSGDQSLQYPAAYGKVLAVIATTESDAKWSGSTYGDWCDISAPGTNIISLWAGGGTVSLDGTSMASPHVAGVATMVRKVNPALGRQTTSIVLRYSSKDLGAGGFDKNFGWGRLDFETALKMARALTAPSNDVVNGSSIQMDLKYTEDAGFLYVLLPSTTGREPGVSLNGFDPNDFRFVPVNFDPLMPWLITNPNNGVFIGFIGTLDASGNASATFNVPKHLWVGTTFNFAFLTIDPANLTKVAHISNPCQISVK